MTFVTEKETENLVERFLRYVKIWTTSDSSEADKGRQPSTERQFALAEILADELKSYGVTSVCVTENCYVYGCIPASSGYEKIPSFALLAHMDTVEEVSGKDVKPLVHKEYSDGKIVLNGGIVLDSASDRELASAIDNHETIITSDGTTLLGADDKAGVASIMTAVYYIHQHPELRHGQIEICFSPDEETGHGMDNVPLHLIKSERAYTVDGGNIGELEVECFNAFKSDITFTGHAKHTGSARPDMVNSLSMAAFFISSLPRHEAPETTDGFQGFYAPMSMSGSMETSEVCVFLRDFTDAGMEKRIKVIEKLAEAAALSFGGSFSVVHTKQYSNMKEGMKKSPETVENLVAACQMSGIQPVFKPIRGGTDGSRLTELGIPTPNIFTGGHNYHSRSEWCSEEQMSACCDVLLNLILMPHNRNS